MSGAPKSQLMHASFSAGISQATDERLVEPPKLLDARNVRWRSAGALSKRYGTDTVMVGGFHPVRGSLTVLTTGATRLLPARFGGFSLVDGAYVMAYAAASNYSSPVGAVVTDQAQIPRLTTVAIGGADTSRVRDMAKGTTAGGSTFYAYAHADRVLVFDGATGAMIPTKNNAASSLGGAMTLSNTVRLVMIGSTLCVLYHRTSAVIAMYTLNTSTWTWSASTDVKTDSYADGVFDVSEFNSTSAVLAYANNLNQLYAYKFNTSAAITGTWSTGESSADPITDVAVTCQSNNRCWITYWLDNTVNLKGKYTTTSDFSTTAFIGTAISVNTGLDALFSSVAYVDATTVAVVYSYSDTGVIRSTADTVTTSNVLSSTAKGYAGSSSYHCLLSSRPFTQGGYVFCWASNQLLDLRLDAGSLALLNATPMAPVSFHDPGSGTSGSYSVVSSGTNTWRSGGSAYTYEVLNGVYDNFDIYSLLQVDIDFASWSRWNFATLGPSSYFSGMALDGKNLLEHGLPKPAEPTAVAHAGAGLPAGTYQYVATYSYMNAAGEWVESAPSDPVSLTTGATSDYVTVSVNVLGVTRTADRLDQGEVVSVWINVYRTKDGSSGPYYMTGNRVANTISAASPTVSVVDTTTSDTTLALGQPLYTGLTANGQAEMSNAQPPSFIATAAHGNRLFGIAPDKKTVWFSDQFQEGEQPRFHLELLLQVDDAEGIEALASLDGRLFAFSPSCIYVLDGLGPSRAYPGSDSDYRGFQRVASDVGCDQPQSILSCHLGILFRNSRRGLFLLDRKLNVQEVGAEVQTYLETYDVTTATVLNPRAPLVHFFCLDSDGSEGRTLVFDYRHNAWSVDSYTCRTANAPIRSALSHGGELYFESGGYVYKEDRTTHLDDATTWVQLYARLAWIKAAGLQGHQSIFSVRVAWERNTAHDFYVLADHNYDNNSTQTSEVLDIETVGSESAGVSSWTNLPIAQFSFRPTIMEDEAIGLTFYDTTPTGGGAIGTGKGPTLFAWTVDVAAKAQPFPLPKKQMR